MRFRCEVNHIIEIVFLEELCHQFFIADISLHENMPGIALYAFQVFQIACLGQCIKIHQKNILILL